MAAGTGGHIFPGLAIAKELELRGWDVHWMGTPWGMENAIVGDAGYPMVNINISGVRGKGVAAWLFLPLRIFIGFLQSTVALFRIRPDVVLSLGGYVAFPGGMMAVLWGRALVLAALASMPPAGRPRVGHQAGQKLHEKLEYAYRHAHVEGEVVPFIGDMASRYAWCDLAICRSGAVTVAEIAAAGVASILF